MFSRFFALSTQDLAKGLIVVVLGALLASLQQMLTAHGLDFGAYDWSGILTFSIGAGVTYISKNLLSTRDGKFLGHIG